MEFANTTPVERLDALIKEVLRLAAAHPDYAYESPAAPGTLGSPCYYLAVGGTPPEGVTGCIMGTALTNLGYRPDEEDETTPVSSVIILRLEVHPYGADEVAERIDWLGAFQIAQDAGKRWGNCVVIATSDVGVGPADWGIEVPA